MSSPQNHHYIAQFYLSRWTGPDGQLCRFSRPRGYRVLAHRVVPRGTAFEPGLYANKGLPAERAQSMETEFLSKLDAGAAEALALLESGLQEGQWQKKARSNWSRFLLAQLLRTPEDIGQLKSSVAQERERLGARRVAIERPRAKTLTPEELEEEDRAENDRFTLPIARSLMDHPKIGQLINDMHWLAIDLSNEEISLLTSDRPIWMTPTLTEADAMILMPIGPKRLFTAVTRVETQRKLVIQPRKALARKVNRIVVEHAVKFAYGQTDEMLSFVQKHMSKKRQSSLLERLARKRGHARKVEKDG